MEMRFNVGDAVRTRRKIKNDGTFPGLPWMHSFWIRGRKA